MNILKKYINFESSDPKIINRSKNIVVFFSFVILGILTVCIVIFSSKPKDIVIDHKLEKIDITSSLNVNAQDEWISKSENLLESFQKKYDELLLEIEELKSKNEQDKEKFGQSIDSLAYQISNQNNIISQQQAINNSISDTRYNEYGELISNNNFNTITTVSIELENDNKDIKDKTNSKDLENYIPAGSYVKARMLSSADVSTSKDEQSNPNNMMFEIISPVYAPKFKGVSQEIKKIEGCRIMGNAYGQLWTERAYIRLLKMSCSFEKGKISEFEAKGYVTSFAKEGVRGRVVSRDGYFTSLAFLSGMVEGLGDIIKTTYQPTLEVNTGIATERIKSSDVVKQAGASGIGRSAEMLSQHFIEKSNQYQSVIDLPTGIEVEIVFTDGIDLSDSRDKKTKTQEIQTINVNNTNNVDPNAFLNNLQQIQIKQNGGVL